MFGKGVRIFKLLGFEVKIDASWVILAILVAWSLSTGLFPFQFKNLSTRTYWVMGVIGAVGLFFSIIFHEFSHSLVARKYGVPMKGITLFIFGGVAEMGDEPQSPKAEFMMAVAGPLSSIVIALLFYGLYRAGRGGGLPVPIIGVLAYLGFINGILAAFNLIPAFPLDGGRVLRSILWKIKGNIHRATRITSQIGKGFGILLIVLGVLQFLTGNFIGGMWWALIGIFVHGAAKMSYQRLVIRQALEGENIRRFMESNPVTVPPTISIERLVDDYIYKHHFKMFPVVEDGNRLSGCVTTKDVKNIPREEWGRTKVGDIAEACSAENTIGPEEDPMQALSVMSRNRKSRLMVVENGRLMGIITLKDMLKFLSLKTEIGEPAP